MRYENTPRPLIEDHYHIRALIEAQEKRANDRTYQQDIVKKRDQRLKEIAEYKNVELLEFWCNKCNKEFYARARKVIDVWQPRAFYKTKHTCGTWVIRHITDRMRDPFFIQSPKLAKERYKAYLDTIQPFQTGFNTLYGKN